MNVHFLCAIVKPVRRKPVFLPSNCGTLVTSSTLWGGVFWTQLTLLCTCTSIFFSSLFFQTFIFPPCTVLLPKDLAVTLLLHGWHTISISNARMLLSFQCLQLQLVNIFYISWCQLGGNQVCNFLSFTVWQHGRFAILQLFNSHNRYWYDNSTKDDGKSHWRLNAMLERSTVIYFLGQAFVPLHFLSLSFPPSILILSGTRYPLGQM